MPKKTKKRTALSQLNLRPVVVSDMEFLKELYGTTREDIRHSGISQTLQQLLIDMQFNAQHQHYQEHFPNASFQVIELAGRRVGRIYVNETDTEIRLIDIAILPASRNQGLGTRLLKDLLQRSQKTGDAKPLRLRVEPSNPARRLYESLGFQLFKDEGSKWHMQWAGEPSTSSSAIPIQCSLDHSERSPTIPID